MPNTTAAALRPATACTPRSSGNAAPHSIGAQRRHPDHTRARATTPPITSMMFAERAEVGRWSGNPAGPLPGPRPHPRSDPSICKERRDCSAPAPGLPRIHSGRPKQHFDRKRVFQLREQRFSYREIARQLGIGEGTVRRILRQAVNQHVCCR